MFGKRSEVGELLPEVHRVASNATHAQKAAHLRIVALVATHMSCLRPEIGEAIAGRRRSMSNFNSPNDLPRVSPASSIVRLEIVVMALVAAAAVAAHVGPFRPPQKVEVQASFYGMARCEQLYAAWSHSDANDGSDARGANMRAARAMADCERGDFAGGNAELERLLLHNGMSIPLAQTATAR